MEIYKRIESGIILEKIKQYQIIGINEPTIYFESSNLDEALQFLIEAKKSEKNGFDYFTGVCLYDRINKIIVDCGIV